jgi:hypothetical protein
MDLVHLDLVHLDLVYLDLVYLDLVYATKCEGIVVPYTHLASSESQAQSATRAD